MEFSLKLIHFFLVSFLHLFQRDIFHRFVLFLEDVIRQATFNSVSSLSLKTYFKDLAQQCQPAGLAQVLPTSGRTFHDGLNCHYGVQNGLTYSTCICFIITYLSKHPCMFRIRFIWGKYKTWTPGPWTPSMDRSMDPVHENMDRVHRPLSWTRSMDPLSWTGSMDPFF